MAVTADLALFAVLFTDGMHVSLPDLRAAGGSRPGAGLGMPLALAGMAVVTHYLVGPGLDDVVPGRRGARADRPGVRLGDRRPQRGPGAAAAAAERGVRRQRRARAAGRPAPDRRRRSDLGQADASIGEIAAGARSSAWRSGVVLPLVVIAPGAAPAAAVPSRSSSRCCRWRPAIILYATCHLTHANPYLAAFSAGRSPPSRPRRRTVFEPLGELLAELTKFAALLVFGALLTPALFGDLSVGGYVAVVLAIVLVRPASLLVSLLRRRSSGGRSRSAAWFGPQGLRVRRLRPARAPVRHPAGRQVFTLIAVCIALLDHRALQTDARSPASSTSRTSPAYRTTTMSSGGRRSRPVSAPEGGRP